MLGRVVFMKRLHQVLFRIGHRPGSSHDRYEAETILGIEPARPRHAKNARMSEMFRRSSRASDSNDSGNSGLGFFFWPFTAIVLIMVSVVVWSLVTDGTSAAIRSAAQFIMPVGMAWSAAILLLIAAMRGSRLGSAAVLGIFVITLGLLGNARIANYLAASVEWPASESADRRLGEAPVRPLEAVIVLGGSLTTATDGNYELGRDGERVFTAAQFWHAGIAKRILVTGTSVVETGPAVKAAEVLRSVGVPSEAIYQIDGLNTVEEMKNLKAHFKDSELNPEMVGLITSAFHLPRAMRLANAQGLSFVPLPVAFRERNPASIAPYHVVPEVSSLKISTLAIREKIAGLLGR